MRRLKKQYAIGVSVVFLVAALHATTVRGEPNPTGVIVIAQSRALENTEWRLQELDGRTIEVTDESQRPWLRLSGADSTANGNTGCNNFSGGYSVRGAEDLSFGPMASTRRYCAETADLEQEFLGLLASTMTFSLNGDRLELRGESVEAVFLPGDPD